MKTRFLACAALFAASPVLCAQDDATAPPDPKRAEHEALAALTGDWRAVYEMEAMPGVPGMEEATRSEGTEHVELVCDGLWLKAEVAATHLGKPMQGVWLAGYDPFQEKYVGVWVSSDTAECGVATMDGSYDAETGTWTWQGMTPHGPMRTTMTFEGDDKTVETCYVKGPDGKEARCMQVVRQRAKGPVAVDASGTLPEELPAEHRRLQQHVGTWAATVVSSQSPEPMQATERVASICGGRWLWSDFEGKIEGKPYEGHALTGYDPTEGHYISIWIDSMSPVLAKTTGSYDAGAWKLTGTSVDPTGAKVQLSEVLTVEDEDTRILEMEFKKPAQTSTVKISYERKQG